MVSGGGGSSFEDAGEVDSGVEATGEASVKGFGGVGTDLEVGFATGTA